jgi:hypothetical protein
MKRKNNLVKFAAVFVCLLCLTLTTAAQKRKTTAKKTTKPVATENTVTPTADTVEIREAAQKASAQLKNVTRFIYLLGSIAQGIEDVDNDIKAGKASQTAIDLNTKNKQGVIAALKKLHSDLTPVEIDFRAKASLRTYVPQIGGVSDIAAQAEEQAATGQFKEAGRTLLQVVEKLSDTLAVMP